MTSGHGKLTVTVYLCISGVVSFLLSINFKRSSNGPSIVKRSLNNYGHVKVADLEKDTSPEKGFEISKKQTILCRDFRFNNR